MSVTVESLAIPEVKIIRPKKHGDARGFFSETFSQRDLQDAGIDIAFVQDKLVRVVRGAIFDVAVDLRVGSPTYGQHVSAVISAEEWNQILVPVGFAHGLVTLEPNTEVLYKVSNYYSPEHDKGILWSDPSLEFGWPVDEAEALLSDKDKRQPRLADLPGNFHYETEMA
jgi:dTDP-4-dehydrorhamnose 3,5-epimerase